MQRSSPNPCLVVALALASALAPALGACSSSSKGNAPLALDQGCQPLLGGYDCFLPYPSDYFRVADATMPSGFRIAPSGAGKPMTDNGASADFSEWRPIDGYSRVPLIAAVLPGDVARDGLVGVLDSPDAAASPASASILLDVDQGTLVPHFTDVDRDTANTDHRAILVHPAVQLRPNARYVVALKGLKLADGSLAPAAEGFRRLRDKIGDPAVAPLAARFETDVFAPLQKAGVSRAQLQLAWDFTTTSGDLSKADMLRVRELTLAWLAQNTPKVAVTKVIDAPAPNIAREIQGTVEGPLFMQSPAAGAELARDASGKVTQNGTVKFPFTAHVPTALTSASAAPGRAIAYGHGFFGDQTETETDAARNIAARLAGVTFGIDWWGMSKSDMDSLFTNIIDHTPRAMVFTDRVHQAMANWITMTAAIRTSLVSQPAFARTAAPSPVYDPTKLVYFGASQGHILGATMNALDPDMTRVVLNVGGAGFSHMMFRSIPFQGFLTVIALKEKDPLDQKKMGAQMQAYLDRIDPATYAEYMFGAKLPGNPADRRVLMQTGLVDVQVPNCASWLHARLLGIGELAPNAQPIWGVPQVSAPQTSAVTVFDFGQDPSIYLHLIPPDDDNPVHEGVRALDTALNQMDRFYTDGTIIDPCGGPCVVK